MAQTYADRIEYYRAYHIANRERRNARSKAWRDANPDRSREQWRRWAKANPEGVKAKYDRYMATENGIMHKRAQHRAQHARWYWSNLQEARLVAIARQARYRARKLGAPGCASKVQVTARIEYWGSKCWLCGKPFEAIDHVKPLAGGGSNWPANLRPICQSCNSAKGARPLTAALAMKG